MLQQRTIDVLRAIVQDYIVSKEPIGSQTLVDRHDFGVSSATIRNDMALLEEEELIKAPHTSSGRVPTDKGYRLFVDRLAEVKPLSPAEKIAIESLLVGANDLDDVLSNTVRTLSKLTNQMAVIQYPTLGKSTVRNVELFSVSETRLLLLLITDSTRYEQHTIELGVAVDDAFVAEIRAKLNAVLTGQPLTMVKDLVINFTDAFGNNRSSIVQKVLESLLETVDANRTEKLIVAGTANLARRESDFIGSITPVLDALEEQVVLLRLISEMQAEQHGVSLRIGRENPFEGLSETSVVVTGYENQGNEVAKLGVIGPTRMDYSANIAAVRAVARYLTNILQG